MVSPSGKWYFTGPRPIDHPDDNPVRGIIGGFNEREYSYRDFRQHAGPETFDAFLSAFAKAVAQMPVLEFFMLTSELGRERSGEMEKRRMKSTEGSTTPVRLGKYGYRNRRLRQL
ncbi:conserved hypothetical protein [Pyrenophora tritici-repentis Pt-1C-BFP]|uniref:Uncharacterized protein n=1 Tax=Pyrenophora tritici-repentis (strain Pt-1C-BFP) TaxID=426418 RepID=B2WKT5_PYRTR|nr:uncharacterized protein PTRG_10595 [Pyrenophora tritici-repentis Pt-1C-BFP]EDU43645.1 conserved hypothetical protein [Pyrenophora tritici-repentis Pt-1C-BFP]